ncbi:pyridoxamine 5'-phosphate oxidase [Lentzea sp. NBRC 105346]|uniref:pyridoxamine 5'-phosphate oxidase family protein n=1 Tax=Lentzea sp. NBRC 105346 TaxID=3032205 RepID=UPI0024A120F3|nr:pyridoxamine 5'-phosphate oxidase family protein [Lentzea sp. NBRC 105346]GLZ33120.1 pyridoxamine 5'-phosphate oxidase [Lentzea sp. NBRC 105346]
MASWAEFTKTEPEFAELVRKCFARNKHAFLATIRRDGSPRLSGIDPEFTGGELVIGSMTGAMKTRDLLRDPRFALHSTSSDQTMAEGDAKVRGTMVRRESTKDGDTFVADITEAVRITVEGDELVIVSWHEGRGISRAVRK